MPKRPRRPVRSTGSQLSFTPRCHTDKQGDLLRRDIETGCLYDLPDLLSATERKVGDLSIYSRVIIDAVFTKTSYEHYPPYAILAAHLAIHERFAQLMTETDLSKIHEKTRNLRRKGETAEEYLERRTGTGVKKIKIA